MSDRTTRFCCVSFLFRFRHAHTVPTPHYSIFHVLAAALQTDLIGERQVTEAEANQWARQRNMRYCAGSHPLISPIATRSHAHTLIHCHFLLFVCLVLFTSHQDMLSFECRRNVSARVATSTHCRPKWSHIRRARSYSTFNHHPPSSLSGISTCRPRAGRASPKCFNSCSRQSSRMCPNCKIPKIYRNAQLEKRW